MIQRILGIDPGLSGALAVMSIYEDNSTEFSLMEFPVIENEPNWYALADMLSCMTDVKACMEKVHAMPKQGVSSMFKFGRVYGGLQAMLSAFKISYSEVTPQAWQKVMHQGVPSLDSPKARSKVAALSLFPKTNFILKSTGKVPHDGAIDAALIAEFYRRFLGLGNRSKQ